MDPSGNEKALLLMGLAEVRETLVTVGAAPSLGSGYFVNVAT
jgi:hypothetical protein